MKRLAPKLEIIRRLFALSGNQCAFPGCTAPLVKENGEYVAHVCHIEAALEGGERYNNIQTDEERRAFENLLILCYEHHIETDNVHKYSVDDLKKMKHEHEKRFMSKQYKYPGNIPTLAKKQIVDRLKSIEKKLDVIGTHTEETNVLIKQALAGVNQMLQLANTDSIYSKQLEFLKSLKRDQKPKTAYEALVRFKEENWSNISPELKYKVIANIALALFDLGRTREAGTWLVQLGDISFTSKDSLSFLCLGYALTGKFSEFDNTFERALQSDRTNANLWIAFINRNQNDPDFDGKIAQIPQEALNHKEVQFQIGEVFFKRGEIDRGMQIVEKCIDESDPISVRWNIQALVASQKLLEIQKSSNQIAALKESEIEAAKWAYNRLSESWQYIGNSEMASTYWYMLMNKGLYARLMLDDVTAKQDLEQAWRLSKNFLAYRNLLVQYMLMSNYSDAEQLLTMEDSVVSTDEERAIICNIKVNLLMSQQKRQEAAIVLDEFCAADTPPIKLLFLAFQIALQTEENFDKAQQFAQKLSEKYPASTEAQMAMAMVSRINGNSAEAIQHLHKALAGIETSLDRGTRIFEIAKEFYSLGEYSIAADLYEQIVNPEVCDELFRLTVLSHFHNANYERASYLIENIKAKIQPSPALTEIQIHIFQNQGEFSKVIETVDTFLEVAQEKHRNYFRLLVAKICRSRDELDLTRHYLDAIDDFSGFETEEHFIIASLLIYCGDLQRAKDVAYSAWVKDYRLPYAHQNYVALWMEVKEEDKELYPATVGMETMLELLDEDGHKLSFLLTDYPSPPCIDSFNSGDSFVRQVLGKTVGETIQLSNRIGKGNTLEIKSIMTKYVYAFRESIRLLGLKYAEESGVIVINADEENNFKELNEFVFKHSIENNKHQDQVINMYANGPCPMGFISKLLKRNYIEVWFSMLHNRSTSIKCYAHNELQGLELVLSGSSKVVLDLSALLTNFFILRERNVLTSLKADFIISTATFSEIMAFKQNLDRKEAGNFSMGVYDGRLVIHEVTQDSLIELTEQVNKLLDWCKNSATIMPARTRISSDPAKKENYEKYIGKPSHETLLLAKESNAVICADDHNLKSIARAGFNTLSFSSYQLSDHLLTTNGISNRDFSEIVLSLVKNNYAFIPIDPDILYQVFDESGFKITFPFTNACNGLLILRSDLSAKVATEFIKKIYLNSGLSLTRKQVSLFIFQVLKRHAEFESIKEYLVIYLDDYFKLLPTQKAEVLAVLNSLSIQ